MRPFELLETLAFGIEHNFQYLVVGDPGIGKSDIYAQAAAAAKADFMVMHPVVSDPTDFKGMPYAYVKTGEVEAMFVPFGELKRLMTAKKKLLVLIDDIGQSPNAIQAALMQLLLNRAINGMPISEHVVFGGATNRPKDKAGVTGILEPVKSRFNSILELEFNIDDWCQWALSPKGNMPIELVAFGRFRPNLINDFKPTKELINSPSPRTVASVGRMQNAGMPNNKNIQHQLIKGACGETFAAEYTTFLELQNEIPDVDGIIMTGKGEIPTKPGVVYALSGILAKRMNDVNIDNIMKYLDGIDLEVTTATILDATTLNPKLRKTKAYVQWASKNGNVLFN